uniref:Uncharacterized protein n=1 Tax=Helianthus annuus TaxID=4232 RepID=A0A251STA3_HELAN
MNSSQKMEDAGISALRPEGAAPAAKVRVVCKWIPAFRYRITVTISDKTGEKGWSYGCAPATTHESRCVTT